MLRRPGRRSLRSSHRSGSPTRPISRVHPGFHRHLLLVCIAIILSWGLPGGYIQLSNIGALYLTVLLALRLGPLGLRVGYRGLIGERLGLGSVDTHYLLLSIATVLCQLIWLISPTTVSVISVPLLGLFTLFIAWSIVRLLRVLAVERHLDSRLLFGATAGYLLLGISGGLVLTVLDSVMPGGFHDVLNGETLRMPEHSGFGFDRIAWDQNYGRLNYFAFVSLTTVGFGDITPILPATRLATLALSVMGPLYIAVVLGVVISRFAAQTGAQPGGEAPPRAEPAPRDWSTATAPSASHPTLQGKGSCRMAQETPAPGEARPTDRSPAPVPPDPGPDASGR